MSRVRIGLAAGMAIALAACGPSPWEQAVDNYPVPAEQVLEIVYTEDLFIDEYNERKARYDLHVESCEDVQRWVDLSAPLYSLTLNELEEGNLTNALGGSLYRLHDLQLAGLTALLFKAAELGCRD